MSNLVKFIARNPEVVESAAKAVGFQVGNLLSTDVAKNEKSDEFAQQVERFVKSDDFVKELSSSVGEPFNTESEDEFVGRAKEAMRTLLKKKFI